MKVNGVYGTNVPKIFSSISVKSNPKNVQLDAPKQGNKDSKMMYALSLAGIAAVALAVGARNGLTPKTVVEKTKSKIETIYRKQHKPKDPILSIIGKNRNAEAVKEYELFLARKKNASLSAKVMSGEFSKKSKEDIDKILQNSDYLKKKIKTLSYSI